MLSLSFSGKPRAQQPESDTLRLWGDTDMASVVVELEHRFQELHPNVRFQNQLLGTDSAMPALYGGLADLALFGREPNQTEHDGFLHSLQYEPLRLDFLVGALASEGHSYAPVIFVAKDNPLARLTLAQLEAVLGCGQKNGTAPVRTWGDLGVTGPWATRSLHVYTFDMESGPGTFLLERLQGPERKMNWHIIREFRDVERKDGSIYSAGEQSVDALSSDPYGLAVSGLRYANPWVKAIPLSAKLGAPYVSPTVESLVEDAYPLTRMTYLVLNKSHGQTLRPVLRDFVLFLYGEDARHVIAAQSGFLPLSRADALRQIQAIH